MKYLELFEKFETHDLSGVALILNDKYILLVKPRKYSGIKQMWSIPKGKQESQLSEIDNAIKELYEETGIVLPKIYIKPEKSIKITYNKNTNTKHLMIYIVNLVDEDLLKLGITITDKMSIRIKTSEILKCKFFDFETAKDKVEVPFLNILNKIIKKDYRPMTR